MANSDFAFQRFDSMLDASVNFSRQHPEGGMVETRFVQRTPDRFIVYLSSFTGCDKACRFCHLTQTGQTSEIRLSRDEILVQAEEVLSRAAAGTKARTVHFNFMARGEPLSNPDVDRHLFSMLKDSAVKRGLKARIKLSTIIPEDISSSIDDLVDMDSPPIDLYYSLYSMDPKWRKRWLPKAMKPDHAFAWLADWQNRTGNRVILHWALISGENDNPAMIPEIVEAAAAYGLRFDFNLVRYNPPNGKSSEATSETTEKFLDSMRQAIDGLGRVKAIPRVGFDVKASCGMFLEPQEIGSRD